jgi:hypothetical protein
LRKPNGEERVALKKMGFNPKYFVRIEKDHESYTFLEVTSGKKLVVRR